MNAAIMTIGDEILIGQITDTNSQWIAQKLNALGIHIYQIVSVKDEPEAIVKALDQTQLEVDLIVITGGLGPTKDDLTKKTLTEYFDDELVYHKEVAEQIKKMFEKMKFRQVDSDVEQAYLPSKAKILPNSIGTAAGMWFEKDGKAVVSLPGVPTEMKKLMELEVLPNIREHFDLPFILHKTLITYGVREAEMAIRLAEFEKELPIEVKLAYLPNYRRLRLRLSARGGDKVSLESILDQTVDKLVGYLEGIVFGFEDFLIEKEVGRLLTDQNRTLATAESFTGGNIAHILTLVPGASHYFKGSVVSYSTQAKKDLLGVSQSLIEKHSVVSAEVAEAMALGVQQKFQTDYAIATTGNAGPTTDNTDRSVGDVYLAIATPQGVQSHYFNFGQPREKVIYRASSRALELLIQEILKKD